MKFNKKVLKNGLVVLHEKRDVDVTSVMLAVKYGSGYEKEGEKGMAHFIEHLCFKGTEKRTGDEIAFSLEKVGGVMNAFTGEEETVYNVKLPSDYLELAMDVVFDIFFNPTFPEEEVVKEGNVILEEIRMYDDNPVLYVLEKIKASLYDKPFGMFATGTEENVKRMTRVELLKKHRDLYVPENAVLSVVGNNNFEEVVRLAEKFCVERDGMKIKMPDIKLIHEKDKEVRKGLKQANVALGFHFPKINDNERYAARVFATILGSGMSSRLFREVRDKRGLAYAIKSDLDFGSGYGYFLIFVGTERSKVDETIEICLKEFKKMGDVGEKDLEDGKKQVIGNYHVANEDSANAAASLILEEIAGDAEDYYEYEKKINEVSLEDVRELAKRIDYSSFILSS